MSRNPTISVQFTGDTRGLESATGRVEGELSGVGRKVSGFAVGAGAALTSFGIQAIPQLVDFGTELFNLGQASETNLKKAGVVFGDSLSEITSWADDVNESLGLSDEAVVGLAAGMGDLLVPLGFTRDAAADMSAETVELSGALAAWSGGQYDAAQVSEILTKAMLGERDQLKALGISISQAEVDQRALTIAQSEGRDEVTAMDKALATQALVMEKSQDAQTAWADGSMDAVKAQNELSATVADVKEGLAAGLVPIVQNVIQWISGSLIPAVQSAVETFKVYWPQIQAAVEPIMLQIQEIVTTVMEIISTIWEQHGERIMGAVMLYWGYIRETIANVMTVIQGILDVVMGIISGDWGRVWDGIRAIVQGIWDQIRNIISTAMTAVRTVLSTAWNAITNLTRGALRLFVLAISNGISSAVGWFLGLPGRFLRALGDVGRLLYDAGRRILTGLWDGMKSVFGTIRDGLGGLASSIVSWKGPPEYDSVMLVDNGQRIISGLLEGMQSEYGNVERWLSSVGPEIAGANLAPGRLVGRGGTRSGGGNTIVNYPPGVAPVAVRQADRQYARVQGPTL